MQTVKTTVKSHSEGRSPFVVSPQEYSQTSVRAMRPIYLNSLCKGILLESHD